MEELELLKRKVAREILARKHAEALLEDKARELYQANENLQKLNETLEERVRNRTKELDEINSNLQREVDIRAAAEARLQLTQLAVDRAGDAIFWVTRDSKIIYANAAACRQLGYSQEELLDKFIYEIDPAFDRHNWADHWSDLQSQHLCTGETQHIRKDGVQVPVSVTENLVKSGEREFNCVFARDISERKNDELKLQLQGQLLTLIAMGQSATSVMGHVCDRLQQLLRDSLCVAIHDDRSEAVASGWEVPPNIADGIRKNLTAHSAAYSTPVAVTKLGENFAGKEALAVLRSKQITTCWSCPILWEDRRVGVLAIFAKHDRLPNDFEESLLSTAAAICGIAYSRQRSEMNLQVARDRAEAANRTKSEFLANMSHEIRTPIMAVVGYADLLSVPKDRSERDVKWAKQILKSAEHLKALLNDILDLSQVEAGELSIQRANVDLKPFLTEIVDMFEQRVREKLLSFPWKIQENVPPRILADKTRLRQILTNLLSNAIKFTSAGSVELDVYQAGGDIRFDIRDSGIGIANGLLRQIFEPFRRVDGRPDAPGGTGLGLAISERLAKLMGGRIEVTSTLGVGSRFSLVLPLNASSGAAAPIPRVEVLESELDLNGLNILLVEDNPDNQQIFLHMLEAEGVAPCIANNGLEGLEKAAGEQQFDLILMDMQMPVMDGFSATREIRKRGVSTPIVALTAYAMESDEQRCLDAGCDGFLTKPLVRAQLIKCISKFVRQTSVQTEEAEVYVPPANDKFAALIEKYKTSLAVYLKDLVDARAAEDTDELAKITHRIAGTAANYGFGELGNVARVANKSLRQNLELSELLPVLDQLQAEIQNAIGA